MTVYLDIIFLENFIINYIILMATGLVNKVKIKHSRLFVSGFLGALYAIVTYITLEKTRNSIVAKVILSMIMIWIAFNPQNVKKMFKQLLIFYLTTFAFGGVTFFLLYVVKPNRNLI